MERVILQQSALQAIDESLMVIRGKVVSSIPSVYTSSSQKVYALRNKLENSLGRVQYSKTYKRKFERGCRLNVRNAY